MNSDHLAGCIRLKIYSCFKEKFQKLRTMDILNEFEISLTMILLEIQFFKYLVLARNSESLSIVQSKKIMRQNQFSNTKREVINEVGKTKFDKQSVKVHFVLTHLFLLLFLYSFIMNFFYNFFGSILFQIILIGDKLVNISVVLTSVIKYGHVIRIKVPIVQQKCPPSTFHNFAFYRVRKKRVDFRTTIFSKLFYFNTFTHSL
jgi:hypothetical protein